MLLMGVTVLTPFQLIKTFDNCTYLNIQAEFKPSDKHAESTT